MIPFIDSNAMVLSKSRLPCKRSGLSAVAEGGRNSQLFKHAPKKKKARNQETVEESVEEYSN